MLERQRKQNRYSLVGSFLILTAHIEKHIFPAVAPVMRQTALHPFGALCQQEENNVGALADDAPRLVTPSVSFFKKEIRGHAHAQLFAAFDFKAPLSVL